MILFYQLLFVYTYFSYLCCDPLCICYLQVIESVSQSNTQLETHFASLRMRQTHLYQRLLSLLRKVEVLRCRGVPVEDAEIRLVCC